jgi:hypothetical protein
MIRGSSALILLGGIALIGYGLFGAISALAGLYEGAVQAPLDQPEGAEAGAADVMLRSAMLGAAGIPALVIGGYLWRIDRIRGRRRREARAHRERGA